MFIAPVTAGRFNGNGGKKKRKEKKKRKLKKILIIFQLTYRGDLYQTFMCVSPVQKQEKQR